MTLIHQTTCLAWASIILFYSFSPAAQTVILPNDERIHYMGRIDWADPESPAFDLPGVAITARFNGESIGFILTCSNNRFAVLIDGEIHSEIGPEETSQEYMINGLNPGNHAIVIIKQNEGYFGVSKFGGFVTGPGTTLLDAPAPKPYKIEIIGDSYSVGYGADTNSIQCSNRGLYDNVYKAFGTLACRAIDAEWSIVAASGIGIVHNLNDNVQLSSETLLDLYARTGWHFSSPWDYSSWTPDVVVIAAGTNDLTIYQDVQATREQFAQGLRGFIELINEKYPDAVVLCFPPSNDPALNEYVHEVYDSMQSQGHDYVRFAGGPGWTAQQVGCDWHPNTEAHAHVAESLIVALQDILSLTSAKTFQTPAGPVSGTRLLPKKNTAVYDMRGRAVASDRFRKFGVYFLQQENGDFGKTGFFQEQHSR